MIRKPVLVTAPWRPDHVPANEGQSLPITHSLHRGRVREMGTHAELIALGGIYLRLYELQMLGSGAGGRSGRDSVRQNATIVQFLDAPGKLL